MKRLAAVVVSLMCAFVINKRDNTIYFERRKSRVYDALLLAMMISIGSLISMQTIMTFGTYTYSKVICTVPE